MMIFKKLFYIICTFFIVNNLFAQQGFIQKQKSFQKVEQVFKLKDDTLRKQFEKAGLSFPPKQIYLRSFKYDSELEVWIKEKHLDTFKLFKTYKVCALSGSLGPKRIEGDFQVPEGFYYINEFNPKSMYHLSLGINYPNASDLLLSDSLKPGNEIYVHGGCITVGCIPIKDAQIEELYMLASYVKENGQDFIPVHIFPVRYNVKKSYEYLALQSKYNESYQLFAVTIQDVFDYFNQYKKLPIIAIDAKGNYSVVQ